MSADFGDQFIIALLALETTFNSRTKFILKFKCCMVDFMSLG
jgi:hypothetical protein